MVCPHCGYVYVHIRFKVDSEVFDLWHDKQGRAYTYSVAEIDKREIDTQRQEKGFKAEDWRPRDQSARKFAAMFEKFLEQKEKKLRPGTLHIYWAYYRNHFTPLYDIDIREIRLKHLQGWYDNLPTLSAKYRKNMSDCLRVFFNWLVRWGEIKNVPVMPDIQTPDSTPRNFLEYDTQIEQLARIPEAHRGFVEFLMEAGLRPAEGCALQIRDLDRATRRILVQRTYSRGVLIESTKGKHKSWRTLSTRAYGLILDSIGDDIAPDRFIFINPVTGKGYRCEFLRKLWRTHTTVEEDLYSSTRHSLASQLADEGVPERALQEILGHKDARSTKAYIHPTENRKREYLDNRGGKVIEIKKKGKV
jgi:integrase